MNDVRLRWSVFPWTRYFDDDARPGVAGATITDSRRELTYHATVNSLGELDHLEIEISGYIDDARLARLRSIPRERIEATVASFVKAHEPGTLQIVLEGGLLTDEDGDDLTKTPSSERVAVLMTRHGWGREELARYFDREVRTVDGWISRARAKRAAAEVEAERTGDPVAFPMVPPASTGKNYRSKTTDGK